VWTSGAFFGFLVASKKWYAGRLVAIKSDSLIRCVLLYVVTFKGADLVIIPILKSIKLGDGNVVQPVLTAIALLVVGPHLCAAEIREPRQEEEDNADGDEENADAEEEK